MILGVHSGETRVRNRQPGAAFKIIGAPKLPQIDPNKIFKHYAPLYFKKTTLAALVSSPSFGAFACSTDKFKPRNLYNMPCASCGKKTLRRIQVDSFANSAKNKKGEDLVRALAKKRDYYGKIEKIIATDLLKCAIDYPNDDLASLIKKTGKEHKTQLENQQFEVMDNIKAESEKLGKNDSEILKGFIDKAKKGIKYSSEQAYFKRQAFLDELKALGEGFKNKNKFQEILELAETLPTSKNSVSAFYVKYSRRTSEEIASRLLIGSQATTEHILPQSEKGKNISSNYMVMCGNCNSQRGSMPYSKWMKTQPKMPENFRAYVDEVISRIKNGELAEHWASYPYEVCETVRRETKGIISISVEKNIGAAKAKSEAPSKTLTISERLDRARIMLGDKKRILADLEKRKEELSRDPQYIQIVKYYSLQEQIAALIESKRVISGQLNEARKLEEAHLRRLVNLDELRKEAKDDSLSDADKKSLDNKIKTLEIKLKKTEKAEQDVNNLKAKYDGIDSELEQQTEQRNAAATVLNLPETLKNREIKIEKELGWRRRISAEIKELRDKELLKKSLLDEKQRLSEKLIALNKNERALAGKVNLKDKKTKELIEEYEILLKKRNLVDRVSATDLGKLVSGQKGIDPKFFKQEALSSIDYQIRKLHRSSNAIHYTDILSQIDDAQSRMYELEQACSDKTGKDAGRLSQLIEKQKRAEKNASSESLQRKLGFLKKDRNAIQEKIDNIEISEKISVAKANLAEAERVYNNLVKSSSSHA